MKYLYQVRHSASDPEWRVVSLRYDYAESLKPLTYTSMRQAKAVAKDVNERVKKREEAIEAQEA